MADLIAVNQGGKFCGCGGLMRPKQNESVLMSDPPQIKVECPFCGSDAIVPHPYTVNIEFRLPPV